MKIAQLNLSLETIFLMLGFIILALVIATIITMSKEGYLGRIRPKITATLWRQKNMKALQEITQTKDQLNLLAEQFKEKAIQRVKKEKKYNSLNNKLLELSSKIKHIQEEDRLNSSREIHDQFNQQLSDIQQDLSFIKKKYSKDNTELTNKIELLIRLVDRES
ncbi:MAG: hypothetical protein M3Q58_15255 [Bacteroidota bacterium]|nr:hypothetical protein [Bacteroidota bacterium]